MPRFRFTHADDSFTEEDAARLDATDEGLRLQRAQDGAFTTFRHISTSNVVSVQRRNTELNGTWSWTTVWVNPDAPQHD